LHTRSLLLPRAPPLACHLLQFPVQPLPRSALTTPHALLHSCTPALLHSCTPAPLHPAYLSLAPHAPSPLRTCHTSCTPAPRVPLAHPAHATCHTPHPRSALATPPALLHPAYLLLTPAHATRPFPAPHLPPLLYSCTLRTSCTTRTRHTHPPLRTVHTSCTPRTCRTLALTAHLAHVRDAYSGGVINVYCIEKEGWTKHFSGDMNTLVEEFKLETQNKETRY
jgi:hypothetical protein